MTTTEAACLEGIWREMCAKPGGPGDRTFRDSLAVLADLMEDSGEAEKSGCLRWCLAHGRRPYRQDSGMFTWMSGDITNRHAQSAVHQSLFDAMAPTRADDDSLASYRECGDLTSEPEGEWLRNTFRYHATERLAWEALLAAWPGGREDSDR